MTKEKYKHNPKQGFQKGHKLFMNPQNLKGRRLSLKTEFKKGQIPWNLGVQCSGKTKQKISDSKKENPTRYWLGKERPEMRGKNNPKWKENPKTDESKLWRKRIEFRLWREAVFARDNWTCQKYGIRGDILHPHHIKNFSKYPELRFALDNGITLSEKAHKEFHKKYGTKNNTKEQLEEFLDSGAYRKYL